MKHEPDGLGKDEKTLQGIPDNENHVELSTIGHANSFTETDWKDYHRNPQLDHAAGDYEPLEHREKMHLSEKTTNKRTHSKKISSPLLRDTSTVPLSGEQMDDTIHLLMQEELYGTEGLDRP